MPDSESSINIQKLHEAQSKVFGEDYGNINPLPQRSLQETVERIRSMAKDIENIQKRGAE